MRFKLVSKSWLKKSKPASVDTERTMQDTTTATATATVARDQEENEDEERRMTATTMTGSLTNNEKLNDDFGGGDGAALSLPTTIDPVVERRLLRKLDRNLLWMVAFLFLLAFLDRSNIGNAKIAGMETDLHFMPGDYDWLLTIFYISYIVFQLQAFMWRLMKPHQWCALIVFAWGVFATLQAATQNWEGMMALRFLLGAAEAGFGPSVPFLLSFFYHRHEIGFRCGMFLSAAPLANTFAGALAYGITSGHSKLANWRLLFLVEGIPTMLAAVMAYFFIPDGPSQAKFLTEEEKQVARIRTAKQHGKKDVDTVKGGIDWSEIGQTLMDAKAWFTALMYFSCNVSYASLPVFLPTILKQMGFTGTVAQGLSAPPYFLSFLITVGTSYVADRTQQRGLMIIALSIIAGVGYIMLATLTSVGGRYAGVFLAAAGVFPAIGNILPWVVNNQGTNTRRGMGIVLLNLVGQCGPLLGTRVFPEHQQPRYVEGQSICAAFMFFNALLALGLRTLLVWENKKLDRKYGPGQSLDQLEKEDLDDGSENYGRKFRYVL